MSDHKHLHADDIAARCISTLAETLAAIPDKMTDEQRTAFARAISWLKNVTNPLLDAERDAWLSVADEVCADMDAADYEAMLTDEDKRDMTSDFLDEQAANDVDPENVYGLASIQQSIEEDR